MPNDPIVNDHYGDICGNLTENSSKIFLVNGAKMDDVEEELIDQIQNKLIQGPKNS